MSKKSDSFEKQAYEINELWDPNWFSTEDHDRFVSLGELIPNELETLLDVGCGNGLFLSVLAKVRKWRRICGCDRSRTALSHVSVENHVTDISKLPFRENEFDVVSCQEVLEHLPMAVFENGLDELVRVAKTMIIVSVPYAENLKLHHNQCPSCSTRFHPDFHMNSFTENTMKTLLCSRGFEATQIVKLAPFDMSYHFRFLQSLREKPFQNFTICPVCGFNRNEELKNELALRIENPSSVSTSISPRIVDRLKRKLIPSYRSYRWIAAVYQPSARRK